MAIRWKSYAPNTVLKAVEVQDLADNGVLQIDTVTDLDDANLVNANVVFVVAEHKLYTRVAPGVGADKWSVFSPGLSGLGGWADVTATTGNPTKHEYTDADGNDWTAYEWTGDGTVTTTGGLMDCLVVAGGASGAPGAWAGGGAFIAGIHNFTSAALTVKVGAGATAPGTNAGWSQLGDYKPAGPTTCSSGGGQYIGYPGDSPADGFPSSITGAAKTYTQSNMPAPPANTGSGSNGPPGASGVVIVRVPRDHALA